MMSDDYVLTPGEIIHRFRRYLEAEEVEDLNAHDLSAEEVLGMICGILTENGYDIDMILPQLGFAVELPRPSE